MNLETIKQFDDSWWLMHLRDKTVFDTDKIKAQKDWLIKSLEAHQTAMKLALEALENNKLHNDYHKIQAMLDDI